MPKYNHKQSQKANTKLGTSMLTHFPSVCRGVTAFSLAIKKQQQQDLKREISYL